MAETKVINLEVKTNIGGLKKEVDATAQSVTNLGTATQDATNKSKAFSDVKNVITSMVPGLKAAEGGVNGFSGSLKALLANPVILVVTGIVAALKFVYEAFQSNVKIGKEIAAVWEGLSGVGSQIIDSVMGMVRAFGYAAKAAYEFITLDFEGASKSMQMANSEASESYNQLTKAVDGTTFSILRGLEKQQQANNKAKKVQAVTQSEVNKLLVQSREILTDETTSIKEKKKALEEVTKAETASSKEKVRTASIDLWILKEKAKALGGQAEVKMKGEIRDATIALNEAETENAMTGIKLNKQRKMLLRQEMADQKALIDAQKELSKERIEREKARLAAKKISDKEYVDAVLKAQKELDDEINKIAQEQLAKQKADQLARNEQAKKDEQDIYDNAKGFLQASIIDNENNIQAKRDLLEVEKEILLQNKELTEGEIAAIEAKYAKDRKQLDDDEIARKRRLEGDKLQAVKDGLTTIGNLAELFAGKSRKQQQTAFNIQKAANIASATIDTYRSVQSAIASTPGGPIIKALAGGVVLTAGLLNIKKIASTKFDAGGSTGGGGGSTPSGGGGGAEPQSVITPNFNIVGNNGTNQLKQLQQAPIQAYVVSGEMSTQQSLDRNRLRNATL
ncbi:hypothetical protein UFOVP622_20 [uncultured Caudovirales phage]|uniref:Uncharacterized protein n=1 Tax=uncultured Caudovirales phage TaxID=2100421 RepID=A0A6J5N3T8_9CAUD|nr:hypothetical protein UFOVP622_20 [uncultured Caudovirales phage]